MITLEGQWAEQQQKHFAKGFSSSGFILFLCF